MVDEMRELGCVGAGGKNVSYYGEGKSLCVCGFGGRIDERVSQEKGGNGENDGY
jgi:hypothetical protein